MKLPDKSIQAIARVANTSPEVVRRLLGELSVGWIHPAVAGEKPRVESLRLGLRFNSLSPLQLSGLIGKEERVGGTLVEYRNCCPVVCRWTWSGGFNPKKLPDDLSRAELVHACRTAGRLRARLLREAVRI
jgi:hypothetical protein